MQWVKPDATVAQVDEDYSTCRQEAWREARLRSSWLHRPVAPYIVRDVQGRQFLAWPHAGFHDPFGDQFLEESRLTQFCMRSKGYQLQQVEKAATQK